MTDDDPRNECYPSAPPVGWATRPKARLRRRAWVDARNDGISAGGAQRALDAAHGGTIGHGKKEAKRP